MSGSSFRMELFDPRDSYAQHLVRYGFDQSLSSSAFTSTMLLPMFSEKKYIYIYIYIYIVM